MKFTELTLPGVYLIQTQPIEDKRGYFVRLWCSNEFGALGLSDKFVQTNLSFNRHRGTLRGMHYQDAPYAEAKLVQCIRGSLFDVIIDLRPKSPTFKQWISIELSADCQSLLYIPEGFAHGFQTLQDNTEVLYQMSEFYKPESSRGIGWNDPSFNIKWPIQSPIISDKDSNYPKWEKN